MDRFPGAAGEIDRTAATVLDPGFPQPDAIAPRKPRKPLSVTRTFIFFKSSCFMALRVISHLPRTCFRNLL